MMQNRAQLVPISLAAALVVQIVAGIFFLADAGEELAHDPFSLHTRSEIFTAVALCIGMAVVAKALVDSLRSAREQSSALAIASGEFRLVIEAHFDNWKLTRAEREVALLSLQGHELEKIATLRGAATGTIRAQLAKIYEKSGTANRAQLSAVFVGALLSPKDGAAGQQGL